jgi:hypothetical protein
MCKRIVIRGVELRSEALDRFLEIVRNSHSNGGAYMATFALGSDPVFDWFASRNRFAEERLIDSLVVHPSIREALPQLVIPVADADTGLVMSDAFLLDGKLAHLLYHGGAYTIAEGDGREAKTLAIAVADAVFGLRFGEVSLLESVQAWTPGFKEVAWDLTMVLFDHRLRRLSIFVTTDTD